MFSLVIVKFVPGSIGVLTLFAFSSPCVSRTFSIYRSWEIFNSPLSRFRVTSIPTIFAGSPIFVVSNNVLISFSNASASSGFSVNKIKSSTQTVMISVRPFSFLLYTHVSANNRRKPLLLIFSSNCIFHSQPACFSPYSVLTNRHTFPVPSSNPSGCFI
jgi:hypothetical protein